MPVKKTTTAKAAAPKATAQKDHKHAELEANLAELQKEIEALKGQCRSCCAEIDALKSAGAPEAKDPRVDELLKNIQAWGAYTQLRRLYKNQKI